jgi:hypothetical protein
MAYKGWLSRVEGAARKLMHNTYEYAMADFLRLLPPLTLNRRLLQRVMDDHRSCCALGFVEERREVLPLIVLGLPAIDDMSLLGDGFVLGCQTASGPAGRALRLDFKFEDLVPLQVVLDAEVDAAHQVIAAIAEGQTYFVLVLGYQGARAFRAETGVTERECLAEILGVSTERSKARGFAGLRRALLIGRDAETLEWVAYEDASLLTLYGADRHELRPAH